MITWGVVANSHDASIAVANVGASSTDVLWAGLAKDFSGIPNDPDLNQGLLERASFFGEPEQIIWYERPMLKTLRQWWAGQGVLLQENNIRRYLRKYNINKPVKYIQHHDCHAAYAYYTQPNDDCAVICLDSIGEFETLTIWHGYDNKLKKISSQKYPHSLGLFYSAMTQRLGLVPQRDEYLVSQWASKGDPHKYAELLMDEIVKTEGMGSNPFICMRENMHRGIRWWRPEIKSKQQLYDLAAATQWVFEYCVANLAAWAKRQTGSDSLALAGGGAMNRDAVALTKRQYKNVWVPPNPGDPGSCVGAILADKKQRIKNIDKLWNR